MVLWWTPLLWLLVGTGVVSGCTCPNASALALSRPSMRDGGCCVNASGSDVGVLNWSWFSNSSGLEVLDLSRCNITQIQMGAAGTGPSALTKLFLNHNRLSSLPRGLVSGMFNLTELHLEENHLSHLPQDFLQDQDQIQTLNLRQNRLHFLPASVLKKPSLTTLDVQDNPWHCSCDFVEEVESVANGNCSLIQGALANLTCASPPALAGRVVLGLSVAEVCRPAALTPLFIALPLLILSALVLCWCCGRNKAKKNVPAFNPKKKPPGGNHSNGLKPCLKPPPLSDPPHEEPRPECVLQNQLLLRPCSALLSSTRDLHQEEVQGRLGSVDSLPGDGSLCSSLAGGTPSEDAGGLEVELDESVNVSEVLRDSADREKAYLTQSTQYYSLVPGLQLDDWEHGDFDNVDLT